MKNLLLLFTSVLVLVTARITGQTTTFETDFSNPSGSNGNWTFIDEGLNEFTREISNGELKITYDKTSWHFIQLWIRPFDITAYPYLQFTAKADNSLTLAIRIKDQDGNQVEKSIGLTTDYQIFYFNLTEDLTTFTTTLDEIQFDVGYGDYAGNLYFDDFMLGEAAKPDMNPPTIEQVDNILVFKGSGQQAIRLSGITDGEDGGQVITVEAETSDTSLIMDLTVQYSYPSDTAILYFTPSADKLGTSTVTITVKDDGAVENTTTMEFIVIIQEYGGTGFTDDFESTEIDTMWDQINPDYSLGQIAGVLKISTNKNAGHESFSRQLPGFYDFSDYPWINIKVRGDQSFILRVYLIDINETYSYRDIRILKSEHFITTMFDFTGDSKIDLELIKEVRFAVNPAALTYQGDIWFDDLRIGSDAQKMAYLAGIEKLSFYKNGGHKTILLTDIANTSQIGVTGGSGLIENIQVSAIESGTALWSFDILPDSTGSDVITLTAEGEGDFLDNSVSFILTISDNNHPTINVISDLIAASGETLTFRLSGISDGDPDADQDLSIAVISDKQNIVSVPVPVDYNQGSPYATMTITPADTGVVTVTVGVKDDGGGDDSVSISFKIRVYNSLNMTPTIDPVDKQVVFNNAGEQTVQLTGISDGDDNSQNLTISAISSVDTIVPNPLIIEYSGGDNALLKYTPDSGNTGITTIILKVADDGGNAENNGNDSVMITFDIETRIPPLTGYIVPFEGNASELLKGEGQFFTLNYVDSANFRAIKIDMTDKWDFGGLWMDLPYELDLTDYPYISYEVYSVDNVTYHWNYFYDADMERNIQNSESHMYPAAANQWITLSFDYSDPGDMETNAGELIQTDRIQDVLFNLHYRPGDYPFVDYTGTVFYRNIRIGDKAVIPPKTPVATIDGVPEQVHFVNEGEVTLVLTGISDGIGSIEGVAVTAVSQLPDVVPDPEIGTIQSDGTVEITYMVGATDGIAPISVTVAKDGSESKTIKFDINILAKDIGSTAILTIDRSVTYQKMLGFGTYQNETRWIDLYAGDLGASAVRAGLISNQIEPVNDNDDPYILNREALNYRAFDWDYFRKLKEAGVETFILTSWSPPAWMKTNLSLDWFQPAAIGSTMSISNRLELHFYEEYAESMVAVVKMFEEEAGIHLEAIGLQNEPSFCEFYASAILDPHYFARLIEIVGKRFEQEGITTRLYMPEQVFGQTLSSMKNYIDSLIGNPEADKYCDIIAVHGYANDGIHPGFPNYNGWKDLWNWSQGGLQPKELWMSETWVEGGSFANALDVAGAIHGSLWAGNISLWTNWSFGEMQLYRNQPTSSFYTSKNYFRFIRPGALRIKTTSNNEDVMVSAFEHVENNTLTIVVINKASLAKPARLFGSNLPKGFKAFRTTQYENCIEVDSVGRDVFILPPRSVTTFISSEFPLLKIDAVPDQHLGLNDPEQTITLTGINDGMGGTASLTLSVKTDNATLITGLNVSAVQPDGTATLNYTPGTDQTGSGRIIVTVTDGSNETEISFYVFVIDYTGVKTDKSINLKVYPNPAKDRLYIEIPEPTFTNLTVSDLTGRIVVSKQLLSVQTTSIETSGFEPGLYVIILGNGREYLRAKFVIE